MHSPKESGDKQIGAAVVQCFTSPNEADSNGETANVVDGLFAIARALDRVAEQMKGRGVRNE
jgi:hypothetical protein